MRITLIDWWNSHGRFDIPWKKNEFGKLPLPGQSLDPYGIWVAEVMLQQTQLKVMLPFWKRWMNVFPSLEVLASSTDQSVLITWQGLGYYLRARRMLVASHYLLKAGWPRTLEGWLQVPGIGLTTAGSILSSAFDLPFPILDGNVKRVLARMIAFEEPPSSQIKLFWKLSEALLDVDQPRNFNQALMDLGATLCKPKNPKCYSCPWRNHCIAYSLGKVHHYPVRPMSKPLPFEVIGVGVVLNPLGKVVIDQRKNEGPLGGLWEFPGGKQEKGETIKSTILREIKEELGITVSVEDELITFDHSYTHKRLRFVVHICNFLGGEPRPLASQEVRWVLIEELSNYPFPAANAKIISTLKEYIYSKGRE